MPVRARVFFSRGRYNGVRAVQRDVDAFLQWYNRERPHQGHANRGLTPAERMRELGCPA
jgi:transposase InsO family protein